jgi:microcystin-dependent protein
VLANGIPSGVITMWSGSIASIPSGWLLCDGTNSTPDLRNRFVVGAGNIYAVGATGGSANATLVSHNHTATSSVTDPQHNHTTFSNATTNQGNGPATYFWSAGDVQGSGTFTSSSASTGISVSTSISTEGSSASNANLPPYYALAYIMKA